jgi:hypothetical protein
MGTYADYSAAVSRVVFPLALVVFVVSGLVALLS